MGAGIRPRRPRRLILLASAVVVYALAAWAVTPGFFDGIAPPAPYRFVSPPAALAPTNQQPLTGHGTVKVGSGGVTESGNVYTQDSQASLAFLPGTFAAPPDSGAVTVTITPQSTFPPPSGFALSTNVYCFMSSTALAAGKDPLVTLQYSSAVLSPSDVYEYVPPSGPWKKIGNVGAAAPYYIAARTSTLGCYAGGYVPGRTSPNGGGASLPVIAALAVAVLVLAAIPLLVLRRRGAYEDDDDS